MLCRLSDWAGGGRRRVVLVAPKRPTGPPTRYLRPAFLFWLPRLPFGEPYGGRGAPVWRGGRWRGGRSGLLAYTLPCPKHPIATAQLCGSHKERIRNEGMLCVVGPRVTRDPGRREAQRRGARCRGLPRAVPRLSSLRSFGQPTPVVGRSSAVVATLHGARGTAPHAAGARLLGRGPCTRRPMGAPATDTLRSTCGDVPGC